MRNNTATFNFPYSINSFMRTYLKSVGQNSAASQQIQRQCASPVTFRCCTITHQRATAASACWESVSHQDVFTLSCLISCHHSCRKNLSYLVFTVNSLLDTKPPSFCFTSHQEYLGNLADNFVNGERCFLATDCCSISQQQGLNDLW